jgi:ribosomal-protein-alanine N-acetyltransferase
MTAPDMSFFEVTLPEATRPGATTPGATTPEMILREMTWRDIPALTALEPELFAGDAWSEQTWWAELAGRPRRCYVVGDHAGTVAGYAGIDCGGEVADVMTIAVVPAARGQGLGTALMGWLTAQARRAGAEYLMLEVRADHAVAQRLYRAAGFTTLTVRRRYYQPGDVDALIMRMHLGDLSDRTAEDRNDRTAEDRNDRTAEDCNDHATEDPTDQLVEDLTAHTNRTWRRD